MTELTLQDAEAIAQREIDAIGTPGEMVVDRKRTQTRAFGWLFRAETKRFLETGDSRHRIPGVGILAVERSSGVATFLSTALPPEQAIQAYVEGLSKNK
ncbi:MAG: YrhB domain-containing protein [Pseudomonadota bacterium]